MYVFLKENFTSHICFPSTKKPCSKTVYALYLLDMRLWVWPYLISNGHWQGYRKGHLPPQGRISHHFLKENFTSHFWYTITTKKPCSQIFHALAEDIIFKWESCITKQIVRQILLQIELIREYALIQEYIRVFCSFGTDAVTPSKDLSEVLAPYNSSRICQGLWPSTRRPMSSRTLVGLT